MDYKLIKCENLHDGAVFRVILERAKGNVLEAAMLARDLQCPGVAEGQQVRQSDRVRGCGQALLVWGERS